MGFQRGAEDAGGRQQFITAGCMEKLESPLSEVHGMGMGRGDAFQAGSAQDSAARARGGFGQAAWRRQEGLGREQRMCSTPGLPDAKAAAAGADSTVNDPGVSWQE